MPSADLNTSSGPQRGFLHSLCEYGDRLGLPPAMYRKMTVRYVVQLSVAGEVRQVIDTADAEHNQPAVQLPGLWGDRVA